jgi:hypothetical protein
VRVSEALKRRGLSISPAGVRCVWQRHDLTSMKLRLKALDAKAAQERILLTEAQIAALEKAKADKEAHGEFESECPGYCGAQDTFYVGTLKGVGWIYQKTVIDTYAKVAFAKLYDRKTPITAAEILNDRVVPFYDEHGIRLSRVLTDRGTEFCGNESHECELYLAIEDIDHTRTKTKRPQPTASASLPSHRARRVLPHRVPQEDLSDDRRAAAAPGAAVQAVHRSAIRRQAARHIAYRLYLPKEWVSDSARRDMAGVPEAIAFVTKPEIALAQIEAALRAGVPQGVVLMDADYVRIPG